MSVSDQNLREVIARIDERTLTLLKSHDQLRESLDEHINSIYNDVEKHYTKKSEFDPIRKLVFGFVGFMLLSVGGMFIGLIVKSNSSIAFERESNPPIIRNLPNAIKPPPFNREPTSG